MRMLWFTTTCSSLVVVASFLIGCDQGTKKEFGEPPNFQITSETKIDYLTVYYYSLPSCLKCHVDVQGPNLSTYESLVSEVGSVKYVIDTGEMPPRGNEYQELSDCQKLVMDTWIARGMPAKGGTSLGAPGNDCY